MKMELLFIYLPLLLFTITCLITFRSKSSKNDQQLLLPPGPRKLPVIGNLHHLIGSLPHRSLASLSKTYGPLMHLKLGEISMVVASSAEAAKEIMKTHDLHFATRPLFPSVDILSYGGKTVTIAPYGEYWRQMRKISVVELLSAKRVQSFRSTREEEVRNLIRSISTSMMPSRPHDQLINLSEMLTKTVNNIAATAATGGKLYEDQQTAFVEGMYEAVAAAGGFNLADLFPSWSRILALLTGWKHKLERTHRRLDRILQGIIRDLKEKKKKKKKKKKKTLIDGEEQEGFVDVLLRLQAEGGLPFDLTADCIKAVTLDLSLAGSETASSLMQWIISELMKNPRVMQRAQSELRETLKGKTEITESDVIKANYLKLVIKETLRLHPPVPLLLPRECMKQCEVLGYTIPEKTRVVVNVWAIGRDPKCWEDAEEFKPERFEGISSSIDFKGSSFEFLPFGAGRRMCPGMLLGLANVELLLAQLLYYFDWELPSGIEPEDLDMTESFGVAVHRNTDLYLHAIPRIPLPAAAVVV